MRLVGREREHLHVVANEEGVWEIGQLFRVLLLTVLLRRMSKATLMPRELYVQAAM